MTAANRSITTCAEKSRGSLSIKQMQSPEREKLSGMRQKSREAAPKKGLNWRPVPRHIGRDWLRRLGLSALVLPCALILSLLTIGCSTTPRTIWETEIVEVRTETIVPVPASLTRPHPIPPAWLGMPYSALEAVALECAAELISANADKSAIRSLPHE